MPTGDRARQWAEEMATGEFVANDQVHPDDPDLHISVQVGQLRPRQLLRFSVRIVREVQTEAGTVQIVYRTKTYGPDAGSAGQAVGDRIRANDLDGIEVTGSHVPVPPGEQANLVIIDVIRIRHR